MAQRFYGAFVRKMKFTIKKVLASQFVNTALYICVNAGTKSQASYNSVC